MTDREREARIRDEKVLDREEARSTFAELDDQITWHFDGPAEEEEHVRTMLAELRGSHAALRERVERYREHLDEFADLVEHVTDLSDGSGLDALAGTVRNREIEDGRWSDLNGLYRELVDLRAYAQRAHRALNDGEDDGE